MQKKTIADCEECLSELQALNFDRFGQDYLLTWDMKEDDVKAVYYTAKALECLHDANIASRLFDSGLGVSIFRDKSTRTRFAFSSAASLLGLSVSDFDETKSQIGHGETVRESATMFSFLTEAIGIRDDMFIHAGHEYQVEVAQSVQESFDQGVLPQRPVVVNLQCDRDHPTQSMADLMHLAEHFGGSLDDLKGKKIAISWAYSPSYGKPLSVPQGLIGLLTRFGMHVTLAHPEGYGLMPDIVQTAGEFAAASGGSFTVVNDMKIAFEEQDVVYPKSWAPVHIMEKRTELLKQGAAGAEAMAQLEKECITNNKKFIDWECTEDMMKLTTIVDGKVGAKQEALYCHCLPADISGVSCVQGEVAASVFDRHRLATYKEAGHKPYVIAAAILLARAPDVPQQLQDWITGKVPRVICAPVENPKKRTAAASKPAKKQKK